MRSGQQVFRKPKLGGWAAVTQLSAWAIQWLACYVLLVALGLEQSRDMQVMTHTVVLDLSQGEEPLFASFSQMIRRQVRGAVKKGYRVKIDFPEATQLAQEADVRISGVSFDIRSVDPQAGGHRAHRSGERVDLRSVRRQRVE